MIDSIFQMTAYQEQSSSQELADTQVNAIKGILEVINLEQAN